MENQKIHCIICGSLCGLLLTTNSPICPKCLEHHMDVPHIEVQSFNTPNPENPVISVTVSGSSGTTITTMTYYPNN